MANNYSKLVIIAKWVSVYFFLKSCHYYNHHTVLQLYRSSCSSSPCSAHLHKVGLADVKHSSVFLSTTLMRSRINFFFFWQKYWNWASLINAVISSRPPPLDLPPEADMAWIKVSVNLACQNTSSFISFQHRGQQAPLWLLPWKC